MIHLLNICKTFIRSFCSLWCNILLQLEFNWAALEKNIKTRLLPSQLAVTLDLKSKDSKLLVFLSSLFLILSIFHHPINIIQRAAILAFADLGMYMLTNEKKSLDSPLKIIKSKTVDCILLHLSHWSNRQLSRKPTTAGYIVQRGFGKRTPFRYIRYFLMIKTKNERN